MDRIVVTPTQAARELCIRQARVYELCEDGELDAYREGNRWKILGRSVSEYAERKARYERESRNRNR